MTRLREGFHRGQSSTSIGAVLGRLEERFEMSARRLYDNARAGRILGMTWTDGEWVISKDPGFEGPIPGAPRKVLVPPGTVGIIPELVSGLVSAQLFVGRLEPGKWRTTVELFTAVSGPNARIIFYQNSGESQVPLYE